MNAKIYRTLLIWLATLTALVVSGCAPVISQRALKEVDQSVRFEQILEDPQAYRGKTVLLGGVIVKAVNKKDGTLLEIYQTEIDRKGRPIHLDVSRGRFLAYYKGFLESEIYRKGRKVTIAGVVQNEQIMRLGELDYHYPYLVIKDIHLWKEEQPLKHELYPWNIWDPWWRQPWYPWYNPYWRHRH